MKKLFKIEKYLRVNYEFSELLNAFKKVLKKKAFGLKASKSKLSLKENKVCISSRELYYFDVNRQFFNFLLESFSFASRSLIIRFTFFVIYNIFKFV